MKRRSNVSANILCKRADKALLLNALCWISPIGVKISTGVRKHRKKRVEGDHKRGGDGGDGCEKEGNDGGGCDSNAGGKKR